MDYDTAMQRELLSEALTKLNHLNYMLYRLCGNGLGGSFKIQTQYSNEFLTVLENYVKLLILK